MPIDNKAGVSESSCFLGQFVSIPFLRYTAASFFSKPTELLLYRAEVSPFKSSIMISVVSSSENSSHVFEWVGVKTSRMAV